MNNRMWRNDSFDVEVSNANQLAQARSKSSRAINQNTPGLDRWLHRFEVPYQHIVNNFPL